MNLDRRLLQQAISQRGLVLLAVGLSLAAGLLIVWQASLLTRAVQGAFLDGAALDDLSRILAALLGVMLLRGVVSWAGEISAGALSRRVEGLPCGKSYSNTWSNPALPSRLASKPGSSPVSWLRASNH